MQNDSEQGGVQAAGYCCSSSNACLHMKVINSWTVKSQKYSVNKDEEMQAGTVAEDSCRSGLPECGAHVDV